MDLTNNGNILKITIS